MILFDMIFVLVYYFISFNAIVIIHRFSFWPFRKNAGEKKYNSVQFYIQRELIKISIKIMKIKKKNGIRTPPTSEKHI